MSRSTCSCVFPLVVRLRGVPNDERLAEMSEAIARVIARRLLEANRVIAAREAWPSWRRTYAAPQFRFSGLALDDDAQRRVAAAIEGGIARAIAGGPPAAARHTARLPFMLADFPTSAKPAPGQPARDPDDAIDDGLKIGNQDQFWKAVRSLVFTAVSNDIGIPERTEGIKILLQGIRRKRAQALIREVLDRAGSGVRFTMILALGAETRNRTIAWRLLLYGLDRPGDLAAYGPFNDQLDKDPDPLVTFLESVLGGTDETERTSAAKVIRHYLEGQFGPQHAAKRRTYDRLRKLAARFDLYGAGPLGAGATRDRIERTIAVLIDTIPTIVDPLTPAAPRETAQSNDEHALDTLRVSLTALKGAVANLAGDALAALDTRLTIALEMAFVLPDRMTTIQQMIRGFAKGLQNDTVPSDEIVVLQRLRRKFLATFATAPTSDTALAEFNNAEETLADLRQAVADVKFARLSAEFDKAREAVGYGTGLRRTGGRADPQFDSMRELLSGYTQAFINVFSPHGVGGKVMPATFGPMAPDLTNTVQIEIDLALYKILGAMFLQYSAALRYDEEVHAEDIGDDDFQSRIAYLSRRVRGPIVDFWAREDYSGYLAKADDYRIQLDRIGFEIEAEQKREQDVRTAILLAATLVAGVAGIIARAALIGVLLETSAGATRLAVAVTLTEATAFTATQIGLERLSFGKPLTLGGVAKTWATNVAQFAAFSALSRVLGPIGPAGQTWLAFAGRHAAGLVLQADISALSLAIQGRDFPPDIEHFLIETIGAYAIGATMGYIGGHIQNARIEAFKNEFAQVEGKIYWKFVDEAARTGRVDEASFNRTKAELLEHWDRVEAAAGRLKDAGFMSADEHKATEDIVAARKAALAKLNYPKTGMRGVFTGQLLLEPGQVQGLVKAGPTGIYRYYPQRPPGGLPDLVRSYQRIASLTTTFENGTLVVRELGSRRLVLLIGPGPVPAGLLAAPAPGAPPPHPLSFIESAAGGPLTAVGLQAMSAQLARINRNAVGELQGRGDAGLAALSLLIKYRMTMGSWSIAAVRGLGTALELPRAITRSSLERFFSRTSNEISSLFEDFNAIADLPGANLVFRQPATQRTVFLVKLYRELRAGNFDLPPDMNESAQRGLINMVATNGRQAAIDMIRKVPVNRRLAEFIRNDPTMTQPPPVPVAQQILDRHAADVSPGINLADQTHSPADVRAQIESYAKQHGGSFDSHIPARIEATISDYRATLRRVQNGTETDSRNLDGAREEFKALFLALDRGAEILSFSRNLGAAAQDPFQVLINVGWHPLRGWITVQNAPTEAKVQLDVLARTAAGIDIEEVTFAHLDLPVPLRTLASTNGQASIDWSQLNNTLSHRKWKQILKNIALAEFGEELARSWGGSPSPVRIVVRARSASANALAVLAKLRIDFEIIAP
ncbi:MAG: hypothetical protein JO052_22200 [Bradyrhizobium sp.]|nr:hypothetical protein [Bradyrhizobium sp.]